MPGIILFCSFFSLSIYSSMLFAQSGSKNFLEKLLWEKGTPQLKNILQQPDTFRYQLIYTKIDRDRNNYPHFTHYFFRVDRNEYFNPASTVKMPLAFLALEKMRGLEQYGINKFTPLFIDSAYSKQTTVSEDSTAANGLASIAQYIKKIFLVSDNDAYNRLYEFIGQQTINERLWQMGYKDMRITRRFVAMNEEENRHTNPIRFVENGKLMYNQPPVYNPVPFDFSRKILIGRAHYNQKEELIQSPMDFTSHNNAPLQDLQLILQSVLFPESVPAEKRFHLSPDDYGFLYQYMSEYPSESRNPKYDTVEFFDSYTKFFMFKAGRTPIPSSIRVFNKPGWSYGFLTDVAYIVDFKNKVEFMLSGVIYVNSDGILNDDKYEYDQVGYPFFKEVGNIIYDYELKRKRKHVPDLIKFHMSYDR
jgi:hypothetical protein